MNVGQSGNRPPNPTEILGSPGIDTLLQFTRDQYDLIIIDTPAIMPVSDALILASKVDGVLLVVQANKTRRELAKRAKAMLDKANANVLGVVLNNVKLDSSMYRYYADAGAKG